MTILLVPAGWLSTHFVGFWRSFTLAPRDGSILLLLVQVGVTLVFHLLFNNGVVDNSFLIDHMV